MCFVNSSISPRPRPALSSSVVLQNKYCHQSPLRTLSFLSLSRLAAFPSLAGACDLAAPAFLPVAWHGLDIPSTLAKLLTAMGPTPQPRHSPATRKAESTFSPRQGQSQPNPLCCLPPSAAPSWLSESDSCPTAGTVALAVHVFTDTCGCNRCTLSEDQWTCRQ